MAIIIQPEAPPLRQDVSGAFRVGSSRVLVELVIRAFQDGATPEAIAQRYPTAQNASNGHRKFANALSATKGTW